MGLQDFELGGELGHGSYSTVFKATRKHDGKTYAIKRVAIKSMTSALLRSTLNEVRLLSSFHHGRLLRCYEAFFTADQQYLLMVLEYCGQGDLGDKIKRYRKRRQYIDERVVWVYVIEILEGLKALHDKGVIHRDIKASNVFVTADGSVKIGDFNVSKVLRDTMAKTQIGTPYYMSPEIWQDQQYDAATDIWSLGCLAYELCTLRHPFQAKDAHNLKAVVLEGTYPPLPAVYSEELGLFIDSMLRMDPLERPSATDLLEHESIKRRMDMVKTPLVHSALDPPELLATITSPDEVAALASLTELGLPPPAYDDEPSEPPYVSSRLSRDFSSDDRASITPQGMHDISYGRRVSSASYSERDDGTTTQSEDDHGFLPDVRRAGRSPSHRSRSQSSGYSRQHSSTSSSTTTTISSPRHNSTSRGTAKLPQSPSNPELAAALSAAGMPAIHKSTSTPNTAAVGGEAQEAVEAKQPAQDGNRRQSTGAQAASFGKFASFFGFGGGGSAAPPPDKLEKSDKPPPSSSALPPISPSGGGGGGGGGEAPRSPSRLSSHGGRGQRDRSESCKSSSIIKHKGST